MILLKKPYAPVIGVGETKAFNVYGKSFFKIKNVYITGIPYLYDLTLVNPFSAVPKLSAAYPPFNAIKLEPTQFASNNDNFLTFVMPSASRGGFVDIILENDAGYGSLTRYAVKDSYNPYVPGTDDYVNFKPYVRPWSRGVEVREGLLQRRFYILTIDNNAIERIDGTGLLRTINQTNADPNAIMGVDDSIFVTIAGDDLVQIT
jgi:hypothetical protein